MTGRYREQFTVLKPTFLVWNVDDSLNVFAFICGVISHSSTVLVLRLVILVVVSVQGLATD